MELTPEEKQRIYEEEKERLLAQEKVKKELKKKANRRGLGCLSILLGLIVLGFIITLIEDSPEKKPPARITTTQPRQKQGSQPSKKTTRTSSRSRTAAVTYTVVDEEIRDVPAMTAIKQYIVASGVPNKAGLKAQLLRRYRTARTRRGFRYHNPATNIYIYIFGTKEQARTRKDFWIGMIAKGYSDKEPTITISDSHLASLSLPPKTRFGLSQQTRKQVYREIWVAVDRSMRESRVRIPNSQIMKQMELGIELTKKYKAEIARKYNLTIDQLGKISLEGGGRGWPD